MEIVPFKSIGPLSFGASRADCHGKLRASFTVFRKVASADQTDAFDELGLHLYYDSDGNLEFVEGFAPAAVSFQGVSFLGRDLAEIVEDIGRLGHSSNDPGDGVAFTDLGIALTDEDGVVTGVAAHRKGYYDT